MNEKSCVVVVSYLRSGSYNPWLFLCLESIRKYHKGLDVLVVNNYDYKDQDDVIKSLYSVDVIQGDPADHSHGRGLDIAKECLIRRGYSIMVHLDQDCILLDSKAIDLSIWPIIEGKKDAFCYNRNCAVNYEIFFSSFRLSTIPFSFKTINNPNISLSSDHTLISDCMSWGLFDESGSLEDFFTGMRGLISYVHSYGGFSPNFSPDRLLTVWDTGRKNMAYLKGKGRLEYKEGSGHCNHSLDRAGSKLALHFGGTTYIGGPNNLSAHLNGSPEGREIWNLVKNRFLPSHGYVLREFKLPRLLNLQ